MTERLLHIGREWNGSFSVARRSKYAFTSLAVRHAVDTPSQGELCGGGVLEQLPTVIQSNLLRGVNPVLGSHANSSR